MVSHRIYKLSFCGEHSITTGYRGNSRVSTACAMAHGTSTATATVVATARAAVLSVANSIVSTMATDGSPRKFCAETAVTISTAIRGYCHGNAAITTKSRVILRQLPRQFPRTSNRRNFHGHPWPSAAIDAAILRCATITTKVRGYCQSTYRGSVRGKLRHTNHAHGSPRQFPRQFATITTKVRGYCHSTYRSSVCGKLRHTNHAHGSPRQFPRQFPRKLRTEVR